MTPDPERLFDDDVTPAEFEASRLRGLPVQIVTSLADYIGGQHR